MLTTLLSYHPYHFDLDHWSCFPPILFHFVRFFTWIILPYLVACRSLFFVYQGRLASCPYHWGWSGRLKLISLKGNQVPYRNHLFFLPFVEMEERILQLLVVQIISIQALILSLRLFLLSKQLLIFWVLPFSFFLLLSIMFLVLQRPPLVS